MQHEHKDSQPPRDLRQSGEGDAEVGRLRQKLEVPNAEEGGGGEQVDCNRREQQAHLRLRGEGGAHARQPRVAAEQQRARPGQTGEHLRGRK